MNKFEKVTAALRSRNGSSGVFTAMLLAVVIALNVVIYALAQSLGWYFSPISEVDLSVSGSTDILFAEANESVKAGEMEKVVINFCMARDELEKHDPGMYVLRTAENLAERYPELIELEFLNVYRQVDSKGNSVDISKYAKREGMDDAVILDTSVIFTHKTNGGESFKLVTDYYTADGFSSFFTLKSDLTVTSYNGEEIIAAMVSWVLWEEHPTAYITVGHGETSSSSLTSLLTCAGYNIELIDLATMDSAKEAELLSNPRNIVLVSNPTSDFGKAKEGSGIHDEIERLETFIEGGGNLYVTFDPYVQRKNILELTTFLEEYGIGISSTEVDGYIARDIVRDRENAISPDGFTIIAEFAEGDMADRIAAIAKTYGTGKVLVRESAALDIIESEKAVAYPILKSSASSVCEVGGSVTDSEGGYTVSAGATVSGKDGRDGAIFVCSSTFLTADDVIVTEGYSNKDFVYAVFAEIFGSYTPPYGTNSIVSSTGRLEGLTMGVANVYTTIAMLIPAAIAVVGAVMIIKRKNR